MHRLHFAGGASRVPPSSNRRARPGLERKKTNVDPKGMDPPVNYERTVQAVSLQGEGRHAEVEVILQRQITDFPGDPLALYSLAMIKHQRGQVDAACFSLPHLGERQKAGRGFEGLLAAFSRSSRLLLVAFSRSSRKVLCFPTRSSSSPSRITALRGPQPGRPHFLRTVLPSQ